MSKKDVNFYGAIYDPLFKNKYTKGADSGAVSLSVFEKFSKKNDVDIKSVLDVGCAWGRTLKYWREKNVKTIGVDITETAIKFCKKRRFECYLSSATDLSVFEDKQFDLYMASDVYEHLRTEDLPAAIEEAKRVTKKYLLIRPYPGLDWRGRADIKKALHLTVWSLDEWYQFFVSHDLDIIQVREGRGSRIKKKKFRKNVFLMKVK